VAVTSAVAENMGDKTNMLALNLNCEGESDYPPLSRRVGSSYRRLYGVPRWMLFVVTTVVMLCQFCNTSLHFANLFSVLSLWYQRLLRHFVLLHMQFLYTSKVPLNRMLSHCYIGLCSRWPTWSAVADHRNACTLHHVSYAGQSLCTADACRSAAANAKHVLLVTSLHISQTISHPIHSRARFIVLPLNQLITVVTREQASHRQQFFKLTESFGVTQRLSRITDLLK